MSWSATPNLTDYLSFIANVMAINVAYLPTDAPIITYTLQVAITTVNPLLASIGTGQCYPPISPPSGITPAPIYALAVYNLAGDLLINFASDQPGFTYFYDARKNYGINIFVPGVVGASADTGTSSSMVTPEFMKTFTMANLQNLKTPYGRQYLSFAQAYGTLWGLS